MAAQIPIDLSLPGICNARVSPPPPILGHLLGSSFLRDFFLHSTELLLLELPQVFLTLLLALASSTNSSSYDSFLCTPDAGYKPFEKQFSSALDKASVLLLTELFFPPPLRRYLRATLPFTTFPPLRQCFLPHQLIPPPNPGWLLLFCLPSPHTRIVPPPI